MFKPGEIARLIINYNSVMVLSYVNNGMYKIRTSDLNTHQVHSFELEKIDEEGEFCEEYLKEGEFCEDDE